MKIYFKLLLFLLVIIMCFTNTQCDEDDIAVFECDQQLIIDEDYYNNLESENFSFIYIEVQQDCLFIDLSASGCDGNSWEYKLVDSGNIAESSPEQRYLKFELINNEACAAVFSRNITFDLLPIRVAGSNEIILNIEGYQEALIYSY